MDDNADVATATATLEQRLGAEAAYTPLSLRVYDLAVHGISNRFLWRCPTARLTQQYEQFLGPRHMDVGVGTGFFLDRARLPVGRPDITLLDLNRHCLETAARRIARYDPATVLANLFEPLPQMKPFDSVSLTYVLHCLPGSIPEKAVIFDRIVPVLASSATVFGATILGKGVAPSAAARKLMNVYNAKGIFSNTEDAISDVEQALRARFEHVAVEQVGLVALFVARSPVRI